MSESSPPIEPPFKVLEWSGDARSGRLRLLDQTRLPGRTVTLELTDARGVWEAIRRLSVRGAPAIGVAAGYGMVLGAQAASEERFLEELRETKRYLDSSRPTAVNLSWATARMLHLAEESPDAAPDDLRARLLEEAKGIHAEDARLCASIGETAAGLVEAAGTVLTHCNAGALATAGIGTATAGMYVARARGAALKVYCDETRPLLQGARLTAWELMQAGIEAVLITDNMAAHVLREGRVRMVLTGADRIAANGDAANKIGTYGLAIAAKHHDIPFYVAAPYSTFDLSLNSGEEIPIEQRGAEEITEGFGTRTAPAEVHTYSPAFDVTPAALITGIITDRGIIQPVTPENVRAMLA